MAVANLDRKAEVETLSVSSESRCAGGEPYQGVLQELARAFDEPFALVHVGKGEIIHAVYDGLSCDFSGRMELLAEVARRGQPELVEDVAPLSLLAIPLQPLGEASQLVAVGVFVQQHVRTLEQMAAAAQAFGVDCGRALRWAEGQEIWPPHLLLRMAKSVLENLVQQRQLAHLRDENREAVAHAQETQIELGLLHRLTSHLHLLENEPELWRSVLAWLSDSIPAQCLALVSNQTSDEEPLGLQTEDSSGVLVYGEPPAKNSELRELVEKFGSSALQQPVVLNRAETSLPTWHCPTIREMACVPIQGGDHPRGWLLALNHKGSAREEFNQFGSVETRLLGSVGTILGIHSSNLELYRKQAELFTSSVRALTTAIDAKDRYTSGHSDRVARISVALAEQIGLDKNARDTIYLGGLLHDIGKIGIDDQVLNKPGQLTDEEFEHIKQHPQLGYDILQGVRPLEKILPIVLHHHEAWNGEGYPHGLKGNETPLMARIVAVADAFDAMSSDRPYRKGMPDARLDSILHQGAGSQWDANIVDAFFAIRDEIRGIAEISTRDYSLEGTHWVN